MCSVVFHVYWHLFISHASFVALAVLEGDVFSDCISYVTYSNKHDMSPKKYMFLSMPVKQQGVYGKYTDVQKK